MFYTGIVHPTRPMEYGKIGHSHKWVYEGHVETQGIAKSTDLTDWVKISDQQKGSGIPGRDSHVVWDDEGKRFLLYSTLGTIKAHVSESKDLENWTPLGECAEFPAIAGKPEGLNSSESLTVMRHPLTGQWIMLGNGMYIISENPEHFNTGNADIYDLSFEGGIADIGFAGEMIEFDGKWYRSGTIGKRDYWKLGFTEVEWVENGAFRILKTSVVLQK